MKKLTLLFVLAPLLFLTACSNENDGTSSKLPAETVIGKNTFGCKIGDETFLPRDRGGLNIEDPTPILQARYTHDDYYAPGYALFIMAENEKTNKTLVLRMQGMTEPLQEGGVYPITQEAEGNFNGLYMFYDYKADTDFTPVYNYATNDSHNGTLIITKLDTVNKIISGTFSFDCFDQDRNLTASVTEGRFDIKYKEY